MMSHIIPAASNALMIKYLESQGFTEVYLDSALVSTQLLGTADTTLLDTTEYLNYVQRLANATTMNIIADAPIDCAPSTSWTLPQTIAKLEAIGTRRIIIDDQRSLNDVHEFQKQLQTAQAVITNDDTQIIAELDGFIDYGIIGLQERISIAEAAGVVDIIIGQISNLDISAIQNLSVDHNINLVIDNPEINYSAAGQLEPEFILDTYHVSEALTRSAKTISQNMIIKMFMGN
ncbi:MAG: isocitrate lyase/phosphoenolpyruvate mutase family protein [Lactobacillus sp.]|nr:isocitrate lyase/phosphoenolpyruvate mutase family protein [Lactobacillus sp.]